MSAPSLRSARLRLRSTSQLTITSVFALAQIAHWGLHVWQPRTSDQPPFAVLANPERTSLNARTLNTLLDTGMVETVGHQLVLTDLGRRTVQENSDLYPGGDTSGSTSS